MDPTKRFAELVGGPESEVRLDLGAFLIAAHGHRGLDVEAQIRRIDDLAADSPGDSAAALARHLFVTLGHSGNAADYGDPENSYLDAVLDRRIGIPISLSVLMIEVGRRLGLPLHGVGMPGHFIVGTPDGALIDPFDKGRSLTLADARDRFDEIYRGRLRFEQEMLQISGPRAILARMLRNLEGTLPSRHPDQAAWPARLLLGFPDLPPEERARIGRVLGTRGCFDEGAGALEAAAAHLPSEESATALAEARRLRARLN